MVVQINSSILVAGLVDAHASPTRATNLKSKIYYFLSLLTDTNDNYRLNSNTDGFRNLCSHHLKKVLGNKDFYIIRELLLNPNNPIIETDGSWRNGKNAGGVGFCQGYRLKHEYNTGEVVYKTLPSKLSRLIEKYDSGIEEPLTRDYGFLLNQFDLHAVTIDTAGYDFVRQMGNRLLNRVENNNPYQTNLVYNLTGRWLYYLNQIDEGKIWRKVSSKNHRLNSSITNFPKLLRPYLMCNGESLFCVDVSSSQPYILSSIMRKEFWLKTNDGYNIKTIYPELYSELINNGNVDDSISFSNNVDTTINYSTKDVYQYFSNHTGNTSMYYSSSQIDSSSFMWCNFFNSIEIESIYRYTKSPFYLDFYSHLLHQYYTYIDSPDNKGVKDREKLKGSMMFVLFDNNRHHRTNNEQIQVFETVYPGVEKWIGLIHDKIGTSRFSYLLQRSESYLLLHVICREFHLKYPTAPLITIHDGILTTQTFHQQLSGFVLKRLPELTGIMAGCKTKSPEINPNPSEKDINTIWDDIKPISKQEKYNKNSAGVFSSNIERGRDFLKN